MTHIYKSLVVLLSFLLIFFMSSGHANLSVAAFMEIFKLGPNIPQQVIALIAIGIIGAIGIRRR
jgi:hypothetical protein